MAAPTNPTGPREPTEGRRRLDCRRQRLEDDEETTRRGTRRERRRKGGSAHRAENHLGVTCLQNSAELLPGIPDDS